MTCRICNVQFQGQYKSTRLINHILKQHGLKSKQYYDLYIRSIGQGSCLVCAKQTLYVKFGIGYELYCSKKCRSIDKQRALLKRRITWLGKYGVQHPSQNDNIKQNKKITCMNKYGVSHPMKHDAVKAKSKTTLYRKYNRLSFTGSQQYKIKYRQTCLKKYGMVNHQSNPQIKQKVKTTCQQRYGGVCPYSSKEISAKGVRSQTDKNGGNGFASIKIKEKYINTLISRYGNKSPYKYKYIMHNNQKILYRSKLEYNFIQYCLKNNIQINSGINITYMYNGASKIYQVDFILTYATGSQRLVQIKGNHIWYQEELKNGKFKQKVLAAIAYSQENLYMPYKVLYNVEDFKIIL